MKEIVCLILLLLKLAVAFLDTTRFHYVEYCSLCILKGTHTLCRFPSPKPKPPCKLRPLSEDEKLMVLHAHNQWRNKVAQGLQTPQPQAANMMRMTWDAELEVVAGRWAAQCEDSHDDCRASPRFRVGQNIAWRSHWNLRRLIDLWFLEVTFFPHTGVTSFEYDVQYGHYAQAVWAQTFLIGCMRTDRGAARRLRFVLVCNYGPAGNIKGKSVYHVGPPQSACPPATHPDDLYTGLCSLDSDLITDLVDNEGLQHSGWAGGILVWPGTILKSRAFWNPSMRLLRRSLKRSPKRSSSSSPAPVPMNYLLLLGTMVMNDWRRIL